MPVPTAAGAPLTATATVNLDHLRHNARMLQERAGRAAVMGVVKANAYGHGAVPVARALRDEGIRRFAVANLPEALELREAGFEEPIQVFAAPLPAYLPAYAAHDLGVTVSSTDVADAVIRAAREHEPLRVHVKVDTGMGRIGVAPAEAADVAERLANARGVQLDGLWTHLSSADEEDLSFTHRQLDWFDSVVDAVGHHAAHVHVANSAGLLALPHRTTRYPRPIVRIGLALYGLAPRPGMPSADDLLPVLRLTSRVTHVKTVAPGTPISYGRTWYADRTTRIATVGAGYADGYPRLVSNRAVVGINGRRYPVVGAVCMDMFMVDLGPPASSGDRPQVEAGTEVVLFGAGGPSTDEVAAWAETITYEICTGVGPRVPRRYVPDEAGTG